VSLDGLGLGFAVHFPKAMHHGNGTLAIAVDVKATPDQRAGLVSIARGEQGGLPFEIFPALITKFLDPVYVPFEFTVDGANSKAKVGSVFALAMEKIKNPVTGTPEEIRINHGTGFIFKEAEVLSTKECRSTMAGLKLSWPSKAGFVARITYGN
jgi:hypothetical protein